MTKQFDEHLNEHMHSLDAKLEAIADARRQVKKMIEDNLAELMHRVIYSEQSKNKGAE